MSIREYLLNGPIDFGGAPLGNMFRDIPNSEAEATIVTRMSSQTNYEQFACASDCSRNVPNDIASWRRRASSKAKEFFDCVYRTQIGPRYALHVELSRSAALRRYRFAPCRDR
jgi:hypothetical protein